VTSNPERPVLEGASGVVAGLKAGGADFAVSIPDSVLYPVEDLLRDDPRIRHYVCSREDEGVAMAVGAYLAGKVPVALMEGSGVGYCGLILARAQIQRTPLLLLVGHNRVLGERFDYHGATRLAGEGVLQGLGIPHLVVHDRAQTALAVEQALITVRGQKSVVGLFFPPYVLAEER
jgi:sulfopyruvate decarboxylase TPP-binding subunit